MIEGLPVEGILRAAELERRMLEEDFTLKRSWLAADEYSVLDFCHFLEAMQLGIKPPASTVPVEHFRFYRIVVQTLVEAGELPPWAKERFDALFGSVVPGKLAACRRLAFETTTPNQSKPV